MNGGYGQRARILEGLYKCPEWEGSFTLDRQLAEAKAEMGPERWAQLNAEWLEESK